MGCCCGRQNNKARYHKLLDDDGAPTPTSNSRFASVASTWTRDIADIFQREPSQLPLAVDIPRLAKKIQVIDRDGSVVVAESEDSDTDIITTIHQLFEGIAHALGDVEFSKFLNDDFDAIMGHADDGDPSSRLNRLLRVCTERFHGPSDVPRTLRILKLLHQKVIFPAYYAVKYRLGVESLKDTRGTWHISVKVDLDSVTVSHRKRQHFTNVDMLPECDFEMALLISTDSEVQKLQDVRVALGDVRFPGVALTSQRKLFYTDLIHANSSIV